MTAPTDRDQATRDRLAEVAVPILGGRLTHRVLDALLPVVADLVREGQAEALEEAADDGISSSSNPPYPWVTQQWLRDRAAALRAPVATWDHRPLGGGYCVCGQPVHTRATS